MAEFDLEQIVVPTIRGEIPEGTRCAACQSRTATDRYMDHPSHIGMVHGDWGEPWCKICIVKRQLGYARAQADRVSGLEDQLAKLVSAEGKYNG